MKKRIVWLTAAAAAFGLYAPAETVITSPTGLPDESDVALEAAVDAVKDIPAETVKAGGGAVYYTGDEIRNAAHGVKAAFAGDTPRETARQDMLGEVTGSWGRSNGIVMRTYAVSPAVGSELAPASTGKDTAVDVRSFFAGIEFPEGTTAYYRPEIRRLVVFNTPANLDAVEDMISRHHRAEREYKQVEIKAKFIEVSQSTLNQLGFTWRIQDVAGATGVRLVDDWQVNDNQNIMGGALRTAVGAFGGTPGSGSMVLTKTGWMPLRVAINALEQSGDSDVLSAPSLTTLDGKAAEIWVGEDRAVPHGFSVQSSDVNIHIEHKEWKSELMGVHFSVTPEIQKNDLIRLKLNPQVVDLLGYDNYQVSPSASMMAINGYAPQQTWVAGSYPILNVPAAGISSVWNMMTATLGFDPNRSAWDTITGVSTVNTATNGAVSTVATDTSVATDATPSTGYRDTHRRADHEAFGIPLNAVNGRLPYFRVREIKTQVDVADGNTVGLGGLIYDRLETYKDKVPVLGSIPLIGRLFRSEGERSVKRNLMIFVTASQVDRTGQLKSVAALNN